MYREKKKIEKVKLGKVKHATVKVTERDKNHPQIQKVERKVSKIVFTARQREALKLLSDKENNHILLFGGSRSGKTYLFILAVVTRAWKYPGSRHLMARLRFSHAKLSIWMDTLQKVLDDQLVPAVYTLNSTDHYVKFSNGSEIWIDGLDDKERVDKILGREYSTIFFNEVSQLPYDTVTTVLTRLSQSIPGCANKAYYDCNPAGRLHWANRIFVQHELPDGKPCGPGYACMKINPDDNRANLPPRYIEDILARLPEAKKKRFMLGEWTDPEGTIFTNWDIQEIPDEIRLHSRHSYGLDFGYSIDPAVLVDTYVNGDDIWFDELIYETQLTNRDLGGMMQKMVQEGVPIYADSAEPKSIEELRRAGLNVVGALKGPDSVRVGIDWLLAKHIHITERSMNAQMEASNYTWRTARDGDLQPVPIDDYNHFWDAARYSISEGIGEPDRVYHEADWSAGEAGL